MRISFISLIAVSTLLYSASATSSSSSLLIERHQPKRRNCQAGRGVCPDSRGVYDVCCDRRSVCCGELWILLKQQLYLLNISDRR